MAVDDVNSSQMLGESASVATALGGHQMARRGGAHVALATAIVSDGRKVSRFAG
jgi:TctA family transporter